MAHYNHLSCFLLLWLVSSFLIPRVYPAISLPLWYFSLLCISALRCMACLSTSFATIFLQGIQQPTFPTPTRSKLAFQHSCDEDRPATPPNLWSLRNLTETPTTLDSEASCDMSELQSTCPEFFKARTLPSFDKWVGGPSDKITITALLPEPSSSCSDCTDILIHPHHEHLTICSEFESRHNFSRVQGIPMEHTCSLGKDSRSSGLDHCNRSHPFFAASDLDKYLVLNDASPLDHASTVEDNSLAQHAFTFRPYVSKVSSTVPTPFRNSRCFWAYFCTIVTHDQPCQSVSYQVSYWRKLPCSSVLLFCWWIFKRLYKKRCAVQPCISHKYCTYYNFE